MPLVKPVMLRRSLLRKNKDILIIRKMIKTIQFKTDILLPYLSAANSVILQKNTMSVLSYVLVETNKKDEESYVVLTSGDMDENLSLKVPVTDVSEAGLSFCIDGKKLYQTLKNLKDSDVVMQLDDEKHEVTCLYNNGKFRIPFIESKDYPSRMRFAEETKKKSVPVEKMAVAVDAVKDSMSSNPLFLVMNGIHFDFQPDGMLCVAMGLDRLVRYKDLTVTHNGVSTESFLFTVPKKPCLTLACVLDAVGVEGDTLFVESDLNKVAMYGSNFYLIAKLHEAKFPDYKRFLSLPVNHEVIVNKDAVCEALKRVIPMASAESAFVKVSFSGEILEISAEDRNFSFSASETVECKCQGEPVTVGFNGSVLCSLIQKVEGEDIRILINTPESPVIFKEGSENEGYDYLAMLMPMA